VRDAAAGGLCPRCLLEQGLRLKADADPDDSTRDDPLPPESTPGHIRNYRFLEKVGEGGMGEVYLADQERPVRRRVAIKLIKVGMDTKQVVARFESERQALAMMNHPSIAKVFDAGATEQGRPYFAMEYVKGEPSTTYCDRHRLNTRERLELFMQICDGVQHAHQRGIIHRDIKPSNVLVQLQGDKPVPKIIDFGVAKATELRLTEKTVFTQAGVLIGTPEYMSPEQAEMTRLDIDTRTDVYSLGVLLYELLVGALPFEPKELRKGGFDEIRRKIRQDEPLRPSTRFDTLGDISVESAKNRRTDPTSLSRRLRGDLDWITMRALEKDRTRRYGSPEELAADVRHHLNDEPVLASPPSAAYQVGKFVRRHRGGVLAAGVVALAMLVGFGGVIIGLVRATRAERIAIQEAETAKLEADRANREAQTAQQVSDFLVDLFEVSDPSEARGNTITAREILNEGAEKIEQELRDEPLVHARLMNTMGRVYQNLGLFPEAERLLEGAVRIREKELGQTHAELAAALADLGWLQQRRGRFDEALALDERALAIREEQLGREHVETGWSLYHLGVLHAMMGRLPESWSYYERALPIFENQLQPDDRALIWCLNDMGIIQQYQENYTEARRYMERALEIRERTLPVDHPDIANGQNNLGNLLMLMGKYAEARRLLERSLATQEKALGANHRDVGFTLESLGALLLRDGDPKAARELLQRSREIMEKTLEPDHPELARTLNSLAVASRDLGEYDKAESLFKQALSIRERALAPDHLEIAQSLLDYAALLRDVVRSTEADALEARAESIRATHSQTAPE
jgi:non-specific serine/threonine protein kinase/serine/threonine-protein kinase